MTGSSYSVEAERSVAVRALAAELLQMLLPALLKMSYSAVRKSLQDDQVRKRDQLHSVTCIYMYALDLWITDSIRTQ